MAGLNSNNLRRFFSASLLNCIDNTVLEHLESSIKQCFVRFQLFDLVLRAKFFCGGIALLDSICKPPLASQEQHRAPTLVES